MIRSLTALVFAGLMAIGAVQPAQAIPTLTLNFTYSGEESDGRLTAAGAGSFTIANNASVGLSNLTDFSFAVTVTYSPSKTATYAYKYRMSRPSQQPWRTIC